MRVNVLLLLLAGLFALSACVVEPFGGDGGHHDHDHYRGDRDYGRPVWRG